MWALQEVGVRGMAQELFGAKGETTGFMKPIMVIISSRAGLLEIISILFRPISLSFRLYGNVFAGENMLEAMSTLVPASAGCCRSRSISWSCWSAWSRHSCSCC